MAEGDYKYDVKGNISHFKFRNPKTKKEDYYSVEDPGVGSHFMEGARVGPDAQIELDIARKAAQRKAKSR